MTSASGYEGFGGAIPALSLIASLAGCKVVDAPADLEDLEVYGFVHYGERADYLAATAAGIDPLADTYDAQLREGYRVTDLTTDDLALAGVDATISSSIVGMAGRVDMTSDLTELADTWTYAHLDEVLSVTLGYEVRAEEGDRDCFVSGDCETYAVDGWRQNDMGLFGTSEQTFRREYRWTTTGDGEPALSFREICTEPSDISSGLLAVHQQYSFSLMFQRDTGTVRVDAFWIDAEAIGIEVPDGLALQMAVQAMQHTAEDVDAYVDANP